MASWTAPHAGEPGGGHDRPAELPGGGGIRRRPGYAEGKIVQQDDGSYGVLFTKGTIGIVFKGGVTQTFQLYAGSIPFCVSGGIKPKASFQVTLCSGEKNAELLPDPMDVEASLEMKAAALAALMDAADWQPQSRDYLGTAPEPEASLLTVGGENTVLEADFVTEAGIYPYAAVQAAALPGGGQVAVWTEDPGAAVRAEANNRTVLWYSYDRGSGRWTDPAPVEAEDDGTADFNPRLKVLDGRAYLVWQDASRPLTAADDETTTPGLMDLTCAVFDPDRAEWTVLGTVGTDHYDTTADVVLLGGEPAVVWSG